MKLLGFAVFLLSSCTHIRYTSNGTIETTIGARYEHNTEVQSYGVKQFYLWGLVPGDHNVYVDEELNKAGLLSSANISVREYQSTWNFVKSVLSLGMYIPINYEIMGYGVKGDAI